MINNRNIINPYACEIKKQCILSVAYMVLKIKNNDIEDNKYFKKEYHFVEKNQEIKDVTEIIIEKLIEDVIQTNKDDGNNSKNNKQNSASTFWSIIKIF